ncbi:MAG TPA: glycosyltransferase [Opitutaceae bacterium]|nr:glycosyltransferase [Opitutaceae bacterium]
MSTYSSPKVSLSAPFLLYSAAESPTEERSRSERVSRTPLPSIETAPIVCICHLGWDWVWQRPQQFLSRFAKKHRVLFVETYCSEVESTAVKLRVAKDHPNVTIAEMHLPTAKWANDALIDRERRFALQSVLEDELRGHFDHPILWFYDPMAVNAYAGLLDERLIVYDCMDELSQFKGAPPALIEREQMLLRKADVVFCGGRKMREKRLPLNANTHFYGTGVDISHFGKARSRGLAVAPEIAALKGKVLGYFGVIDERIDYDLLARLADARADWHVVMVGPTAKVDPNDFPQRPNLHWLGGRSYEQLPAITKGFDVCLMPFALNAATEYINPTKALEYMAAGRPIVSTAISEVKSNFSSVSRVANSHSEFITWCIREAESPTVARVNAGLKLAAENTWEAIAAKMQKHISEAAEARVLSAKAAATNTPSTILPVQSSGLAYV